MTQTFSEFDADQSASTTPIKVRSRDNRRKAFVIQNLHQLNQNHFLYVANHGEGGTRALRLAPGQIFGRDIFAPDDELWMWASHADVTMLLIEDY